MGPKLRLDGMWRELAWSVGGIGFFGLRAGDSFALQYLQGLGIVVSLVGGY